MSLTTTAIRNTRPSVKPVKLFDAGGLFLLLSPAGGRWWRLKYRVAGKEKLMSLGTYPDVGLKEAREQRDAARKQLAAGIDTSQSDEVREDRRCSQQLRSRRARMDRKILADLGKVPLEQSQ